MTWMLMGRKATNKQTKQTNNELCIMFGFVMGEYEEGIILSESQEHLSGFMA
jgi:hypothetical protein